MKVTKLTHACVRLEQDGRVLVIDPGIWSEPEAVIGADAVLVTHEHADHIDRLRLAGAGVPVYAPAGANIPDLLVNEISSGDMFEAAGFSVRAVGGWHATVYGPGSGCPNLGYVIENGLYYPGDSLQSPGQSVETLLLPVQASWLKAAEAIDFALEVGARHVVASHDGQLNSRGIAALNHHLTAQVDGFRWLAAGSTV